MAKQTSSLAKIIPIRSAEVMANDNNVSQLERASKEIDQKQKERDDKQLKSQDKLISNLDRLVAALQDNMGAKVSGNKAAEMGKSVSPNYKQGGTWDQRSVKDQASDWLKGRVGADGKRDAFDTNSLRYKFGSLKGIADTTGIIQPDSFFGNLLGRREDRMKRTDTLTKLNPQMKNLKQFGGDEKKVRAYYDKQYKEQFAPAQAKLQGEQYKLDSLMASGISEKELERTIGGKKQIKSRDAAAADLLMKDKFKTGEVKEMLAEPKPEMSKTQGFTASGIGASNVIPFPSKNDNFVSGAEKEGELENIRLMNEQNSVLKSIQENTASMPRLLEAFNAEVKRETEADKAQLEATAQAGSGSGSGIMDLAGDLMGKGKGKIAGAATKAGGLLRGAGSLVSKAAVPLAVGASIIGGGVTAYQGYTAASEAEAKGEITKEEATVKKSGAVGEGVGQAAGGVAGALKGAALGAAVGSAIPVVGTAIGGVVGAAIGGLGGSYLGGKVGNFVGETGGKIKNWFSGPNADKSGAETKVQTMAATPSSQGKSYVAASPDEAKAFDEAYFKARSEGKSVKESKEIALGARKEVQNQAAKVQANQPIMAERVSQTSADVQAAKEQPAMMNTVQTNVQQTNVEQRSTQAIKPPIRNQDSSYGRMLDKRFVY